MDFTEDDRARFMANVYPEPNSGCWLWDGALRNGQAGYGAIQVGARLLAAHRMSFELHVGAIPRGMFVCHRCDVPGCVNPAHLFLGTPLDNMRDKVAKGRASSGPVRDRSRFARGERHHSSKVTADEVRAMRTAYARGVTQKSLAACFGLKQAQVSCIVRGTSWTHVEAAS